MVPVTEVVSTEKEEKLMVKLQRTSSHYDAINDNLSQFVRSEFINNMDAADVQFVLKDDYYIMAHKLVLMTAPSMQSLLTAGASSSCPVVIVVPDVDPVVMQTLISFLYTGLIVGPITLLESVKEALTWLLGFTNTSFDAFSSFRNVEEPCNDRKRHGSGRSEKPDAHKTPQKIPIATTKRNVSSQEDDGHAQNETVKHSTATNSREAQPKNLTNNPPALPSTSNVEKRRKRPLMGPKSRVKKLRADDEDSQKSDDTSVAVSTRASEEEASSFIVDDSTATTRTTASEVSTKDSTASSSSMSSSSEASDDAVNHAVEQKRYRRLRRRASHSSRDRSRHSSGGSLQKSTVVLADSRDSETDTHDDINNDSHKLRRRRTSKRIIAKKRSRSPVSSDSDGDVESDNGDGGGNQRRAGSIIDVTSDDNDGNEIPKEQRKTKTVKGVESRKMTVGHAGPKEASSTTKTANPEVSLPTADVEGLASFLMAAPLPSVLSFHARLSEEVAFIKERRKNVRGLSLAVLDALLCSSVFKKYVWKCCENSLNKKLIQIPKKVKDLLVEWLTEENGNQEIPDIDDKMSRAFYKRKKDFEGNDESVDPYAATDDEN